MPVGRRTIKSMNRLCNRPTTLHANKGHEMVAFMGVYPPVKHSDSRSLVLRKSSPTTVSSSRKQDDMKTHYHQLITKILVSAAIALGSWVVGAAPANADENPIGTEPNPFGALGCSCREIAPPGGPAPGAEMERGIRMGLSASPGQPQP